MVLPRPQRVERGEISIRHGSRYSGPAHAGDIDANVIGADLCDDRTTYTVLHHTEHADQSVKEPNRTGGEQPVVVEVVSPFENDMVPTSHDDKDSQDDVQDQEELVRQSSEVQVTQDQHGAGEHCGDNAPEPIRHLGLD